MRPESKELKLIRAQASFHKMGDKKLCGRALARDRNLK